jgi:SHS2 domain-containing protein
MQKYRDFDHTGDLGVEVFGDSLPALFRHAGEALVNIITDADTIRIRESKAITVQAEGLEQLMVRWLNELLFLFESEGLLFKRFVVDAVDSDHLAVTAHGEFYDMDRHPIKTTVKGATYHQLEVVQEADRWRAAIIFDL